MDTSEQRTQDDYRNHLVEIFRFLSYEQFLNGSLSYKNLTNFPNEVLRFSIQARKKKLQPRGLKILEGRKTHFFHLSVFTKDERVKKELARINRGQGEREQLMGTGTVKLNYALFQNLHTGTFWLYSNFNLFTDNQKRG